MADSMLIPIEEREVTFYDDVILAVKMEDEAVYVPVRPICDLLGVSWNGQRERINRDAVLSDEMRFVRVTRANSSGGNPNVLALPLNMLHGWLFGINASRVKEEIRDKLIRYQRECYNVLSEAFLADKVTARLDPDMEELLNTNSPTAQAYKMIMAMAQMARQQLLIESRLESAETTITGIDSRVQILEARGGDQSRQIDNAQASRISQAVKAISIELGKRSGRNEFGGVWGELYRRFEISGYRELPAIQFEQAIHFLSDWYSSLTNTELPF